MRPANAQQSVSPGPRLLSHFLGVFLNRCPDPLVLYAEVEASSHSAKHLSFGSKQHKRIVLAEMPTKSDSWAASASGAGGTGGRRRQRGSPRTTRICSTQQKIHLKKRYEEGRCPPRLRCSLAELERRPPARHAAPAGALWAGIRRKPPRPAARSLLLPLRGLGAEVKLP